MDSFRYPRLQTIAFSNKLINLCHRARTSSNDAIVFDLSQTEFITPFGIIMLAGTIAECIAQGKKAKYAKPAKKSTREFLSGIGFNDFFKIKNGEQHHIISPKVQLKRLFHIDYLLTDQILEVFGNSISMSEGVKGSLKMALNELMTNAFDHGKSQRGCYVCAQTYKRARRIELCIADFGIGIFNSLGKISRYRKKIKNDNDAIMLSVEEGVTSRIGQTAGYGLTHINRFLAINQGKMHILSGNGKVSWNYSEPENQVKRQSTVSPLEGTLIDLAINADAEGYYFMQSNNGTIF